MDIVKLINDIKQPLQEDIETIFNDAKSINLGDYQLMLASLYIDSNNNPQSNHSNFIKIDKDIISVLQHYLNQEYAYNQSDYFLEYRDFLYEASVYVDIFESKKLSQILLTFSQLTNSPYIFNSNLLLDKGLYGKELIDKLKQNFNSNSNIVALIDNIYNNKLRNMLAHYQFNIEKSQFQQTKLIYYNGTICTKMLNTILNIKNIDNSYSISTENWIKKFLKSIFFRDIIYQKFEAEEAIFRCNVQSSNVEVDIMIQGQPVKYKVNYDDRVDNYTFTRI